MAGYDYSSGVWQFEGYDSSPPALRGVYHAGIGAGDSHSSCCVYDGALRYYDRQIVEGAIYDRWFRLSVVLTSRHRRFVYIGRAEAACKRWRRFSLL
ncbi:hypothetical protein ZWY2020_010586 [Hordeum vulgare]|nr:hypothetical protein ZWY2020_010586 [Hordeum vulgare]